MDTLTLSQFQHLFVRTSLRGEDDQIEPKILQGIAAGGSLTPATSLEVYRRGHIVRLTEALGETFEAVWWISGDSDFFRLARQFVLMHPSSSYNLSGYGQTFPQFLEDVCPFPDFPFLPDLARFEWLFKQVFHKPQHEHLPPGHFQHVGLSGGIRFTFGPSVHLFRSPYSVYEVWKLRGTDQELLPEPDWNIPQRLVCYKHQQQVYVKHLSQPEYSLLERLLSGSSIEEALTHTIQKCPDLVESTVSDFFQLLNHTEIILNVTIVP